VDANERERNADIAGAGLFLDQRQNFLCVGFGAIKLRTGRRPDSEL
jgi:hypothetical protein